MKYEAFGSTGFFLAFLRGVIANWLVCLGVTMALVSKSVPGKILACWLPITAFQTMGMEHIVVNMFLHTTGCYLGSGIPFKKVREFLTSDDWKYCWRNGIYWNAFL